VTLYSQITGQTDNRSGWHSNQRNWEDLYDRH